MKIAILGSGNFATAIASVLADNLHDVLMWSVREDETKSINENNINPYISYSMPLSKNIKASTDFSKVIEYSDFLIISIPSWAVEEIIEKLNKSNAKNKFILNTSKGFHPQTGQLMSSVFEKFLNKKVFGSVSSLIGPSFATEIIEKEITHINIVGKNKKINDKYCELLNNQYFIVTQVDDVKGAEFMSSLKNSYALMSGMIEEIGLGSNSKAIFKTKIINESRELLKSLEYNPETILSYAGIGDLLLTCSSIQSRNFMTGTQIVKLGISQILLNIETNSITVEGIGNTLLINDILKRRGININKFPIFAANVNILIHKNNPKKTILKALIKK